MTTGKWRGHKIIYEGGVWIYADSGTLVSDNPDRPCGHCKMENREDDCDPCLGELQGVSNACCGHGEVSDSYIQFENGVTVRGFTKDA